MDGAGVNCIRGVKIPFDAYIIIFKEIFIIF